MMTKIGWLAYLIIGLVPITAMAMPPLPPSLSSSSPQLLSKQPTIPVAAVHGIAAHPAVDRSGIVNDLSAAVDQNHVVGPPVASLVDGQVDSLGGPHGHSSRQDRRQIGSGRAVTMNFTLPAIPTSFGHIRIRNRKININHVPASKKILRGAKSYHANRYAANNMINVVNAFRERANIPTQKWSPLLSANAAQAGANTNGYLLRHQLNSGTRAQTITPGYAPDSNCAKLNGNAPFFFAYNSWLCENPADPALGHNFCRSILSTSRIDVRGQIAHYQVLHNPRYSQIGCAFYPKSANSDPCDSFAGMWVCDVA